MAIVSVGSTLSEPETHERSAVGGANAAIVADRLLSLLCAGLPAQTMPTRRVLGGIRLCMRPPACGSRRVGAKMRTLPGIIASVVPCRRGRPDGEQ